MKTCNNSKQKKVKKMIKNNKKIKLNKSKIILNLIQIKKKKDKIIYLNKNNQMKN